MVECLARACAFLRGQVRPEGGLPWRAGGTQPFVEPTALAALALQVAGEPDDRLLHWLSTVQGGDGGWPSLPGGPSDIRTALAVLALGGKGAGAERGLAWLERHCDETGGWPWCPGSYAFAEPTAYAALALSAAGRRPAVTVRFLAALQCADGGWTAQMPRVLGVVQPSMVTPTAWATLALAALESGAPSSARRRGLAYLGEALARGYVATPYALGLALLAGREGAADLGEALLAGAAQTLAGLQRDDGSWGGQVAWTAIALLALAMQERRSCWSRAGGATPN